MRMGGIKFGSGSTKMNLFQETSTQSLENFWHVGHCHVLILSPNSYSSKICHSAKVGETRISRSDDFLEVRSGNGFKTRDESEALRGLNLKSDWILPSGKIHYIVCDFRQIFRQLKVCAI